MTSADRLISRGLELIRDGDISGARLVLERALSSGDGRAAFLLGQTFDPHMLTEWQARGIKGDTARARELYERASQLGVAEAKDRIANLD